MGSVKSNIEVGGVKYKGHCQCGSYGVQFNIRKDGSVFVKCRACGKRSVRYDSLETLMAHDQEFEFVETDGKRLINDKIYRYRQIVSCEMPLNFVDELAELMRARAVEGLTGIDYYVIVAEGFAPCRPSQAECYKVIDSVSETCIGTVDGPIDDIGRLECVPVRFESRILPNSVFLTKVEAEQALSEATFDTELDCYGEQKLSVRRFQQGDTNLSSLLALLSCIDWEALR